MIELVYRKALETDVEYLLWLRKETMDEHLISSGISLSNEDQILRVKHLFDQAKIITSRDQNIGLLKIDEKEDNIEIVQIQIEPKYQEKGIGQQAIKTVIENAITNNKNVSLSVLKKNKAKELYLRMGFRIVGEDDSSFIMELDHKTCT